MSCLFKKRIKNTKDFPYFKDFFFIQEAACIVQHSVYNKLVMHIKMSWMKSIQCLPSDPSERQQHKNSTLSNWGNKRAGETSHTGSEACIKMAVRIGEIEKRLHSKCILIFSLLFFFLVLKQVCAASFFFFFPFFSDKAKAQCRIFGKMFLSLHPMCSLHS